MKFGRFFILCFFGILQGFESEAKKDVSVEAKSGIESAFYMRNSSNVSLKLAIINLKDVARNSKAGQSIDKQIEEIHNKSKEDLVELENSIKKMDSDVKTDSDERKVEDLQVILHSMTREKRHQIQDAYRSAIGVLEEEINKVIKEIAEEKGYSLIVLSEAVVYNNFECPDITEEAIGRLDNRVPKIKVNINQKDSER